MYGNWLANAVVAGATLAAVAGCVLAHYEGLILLSRRLAGLHAHHQRVKVLYAIMTVLCLHVFEIWVFGATLWLLLQWPECGSVTVQPVHLFDAVYLSASTYSTVGYGDLAPLGPIRFLAGSEALVGLVLITWSASFTFLEMERYWRPGAGR
jgi:Ion channel